MASLEPQRLVAESSTTDATATAPLIINGVTVRPREKINLWHYGILFLPDFALLLVIAGLGMRRLLRYLDAKGRPS
ncbi:hypothetical protein [Bradyrhizobium sp. S69]|uniref:hypothetical protein n=1 Tax=Bradyrhizobium sp. S69 TaxID=1641856 RepID=UPI00131B032E|nr:hypothetical protein [Bradyrhizobium sp. S69]